MIWLLIVLAFAIGSVLGGQIIGRLRGLDLRQSGSGNLGATNALRSGGLSSGLIVLLIDAGKGYLAVWICGAMATDGPAALPWICGIAVILGHVFSPLAGFKGGKGVACGLGASLFLLPLALSWGLAGFVICLLLSGYVSLSVLLAVSLILLQVTCFSAVGIWSWPGVFALFVLLLLFWAHRENIVRLYQGKENRFTKVMLVKPRS